jgi:hypothetical protein
MLRSLRFPALFALSLLLTLSTFAQERPLVGTVIDVDEGRGRLQIESDSDATSRLTIEIDSIATSWKGFGTMIAGKPEIFTGASGLANVRLGDRVEVRGAARGEGVFRADQITLLGRQVAAPQVGVGQTRTQTSVATPTEDQARAAAASTLEGTIRQINYNEGRIVIQTAQRRIVTVTAWRSTPVWFNGEQYRIGNLEVGDAIRVEIDPRDAQAAEAIARRIDVTRSAREGEQAAAGGTITTVSGSVVRADASLDYAYVNDGRSEVRVDMSKAEDAQGEMVHARDLRAGENVSISGSFNRTGDIFLASTVRFGTASSQPGGVGAEQDLRYAVVTITGTVVETLEDAATIAVRDREADTVDRVWVVDDFIVRTRANTNTTAGLIRAGDVVVIQAFRDGRGNLIAQTIRLRNR